MLSLLLVLAVFGLLIALGVRVCLYLYKAGALRYNARRRSRRVQPLVVDSEAQAIAEAEYLSNLVHSLER